MAVSGEPRPSVERNEHGVNASRAATHATASGTDTQTESAIPTHADATRSAGQCRSTTRLKA